jgi:hypothetical protein
MNSSAPILINKHLSAIDMKSLVLANPKHQAAFIRGDVVVEAAVPLSADGSLRPGELYESTGGADVYFYLPTYTLRRVAGQFTTRLKLRDAQQEPEGPLAWLTIELVADPPDLRAMLLRPGTTLKEVPHTIRLRLGYQVASADAAGSLTPPPDASRTTLWLDLEPLNRQDAVVAVSRTPVPTQERYDRLFQIMTDPQYNTHLEIQCLATVGQRTWNQWFVGDLLTRRNFSFDQAHMMKVQPEFARAIHDSAATLLTQPAFDISATPVTPVDDATRPATPLVDTFTIASLLDVTPVTATQPVFTLSAFNGSILSAATMVGRAGGLEAADETLATNLVAGRPVNLAFSAFPTATLATLTPALQMGELHTTPDIATQMVATYLPLQVVVDSDNKPAIVRREVVTTQTIPFQFAADSEAYMFDAPVDTGTTLVLFRTDIAVDEATVTFYQDSLVREQVYYEPQEFRLARLPAYPHLPSLLFAFNDIQAVPDDDAAPGDGAGDIDYRVRCTYNVKPYINPLFLMKARLEYGPEARFTALTPSAAGLLLAVPQDGGGLGTEQPATDVLISFDDGIVGGVELSPGQFAQLVAAFQSPLGVGMQGHVDATLIDASRVQIGVEVSLRKNAGRFFAVSNPVAEGEGVYAVTLRNRLESPVQIEAMAPVTLGQQATAAPLGLPPAEPIPPGAETTLRYQITPPEFIPLHLEPALTVSILPDLGVLLSQLMINEGYHKDTFDVTASIDPAFLIAPLTGVRVTFDSGPSVELGPAKLSAVVTLRMPLLPRLLNSAEALNYRYCVTNLTAAGDGPATDWTEWTGDLPVTPAGAV